MDLFEIVRNLEDVKTVRNLYPKHIEAPLDLVLWTCPQMKGSKSRNRIKLGKFHTSLFTPGYVGIQAGSLERIRLAKKFWRVLSKYTQVGSLTNVYGAADALILFAPNFVEPPEVPKLDVSTISNYAVVLNNFELWTQLYSQRPWQNAPAWAVNLETERLLRLLPSTVPENVARDFVNRIFAGFALDGILVRKGEFGTQNPVILGLESPGVAVLQNAALSRDEWIPVIQLVE